MKPNILKSQFRVTSAQLRLPVGTQSQRRMATANRVFPEMVQRADLFPEIRVELNFCHKALTGQLNPFYKNCMATGDSRVGSTDSSMKLVEPDPSQVS